MIDEDWLEKGWEKCILYVMTNPSKKTHIKQNILHFTLQTPMILFCYFHNEHIKILLIYFKLYYYL